MNLVSMTIPEDPALLAGWLEQHLVGLDLAALVAELRAVHGSGHAAPINEVLGDRRDAVLARGLSALPADRLRQLLRSPALLLDLQEMVLTEGRGYWERLPRTADLARAVARGREPCCPEAPSAPARDVVWYRRPWVVSLATAAAVLLAIELPRWLKPPSSAPGPAPLAAVPPAPGSGWGWNRPEAFPAQGSARAYLNALADAAADWFKKRPDNAPALARRIGEFRQGCTTLIFAEHKPLPERERLWLVERCRLWARKIDEHLAQLEDGGAVAEVRAEMDQTVTRLVDALRGEAAKLVGRLPASRHLVGVTTPARVSDGSLSCVAYFKHPFLGLTRCGMLPS
jgi:hypothetical protein